MIKACAISSKSETLEEGPANLALKLETPAKESRENLIQCRVESHLSVIGLCLHILKKWEGYFQKKDLSIKLWRATSSLRNSS